MSRQSSPLPNLDPYMCPDPYRLASSANYPPGVTDKTIQDWYDAGPHEVEDGKSGDEILSEMDKESNG